MVMRLAHDPCDPGSIPAHCFQNLGFPFCLCWIKETKCLQPFLYLVTPGIDQENDNMQHIGTIRQILENLGNCPNSCMKQNSASFEKSAKHFE